ncbi:hypothetical protein [Ferruginibacter profundus]
MKLSRGAVFLAAIIFLGTTGKSFAVPIFTVTPEKEVTSTRQQAIAFIDAIKEIEPSIYWPNIKPALFLQNLKTTIHEPISIYPGNGTNFCGYGAVSYLFLQDDPLGYAKLLLELYKEGKAGFANVVFTPSEAVKKEAGRLRYKGILDIHPAEQMWFLSLADHYKGYLNIFNRNYNPGDEDRFWASVNFAKFNRMVRSLLQYKIKATGSDLIRPHITDPYEFISDRLQTGKVVLFINNRIVHKKNHVKIKVALPTHFIVVEKISRQDDLITLVYWDYGGRTLLQLSPAFLRRIIFGITYCTKKEAHAN